MSEPKQTYPEAEQSPNFPAIEKEILGRWKRDRTFETSVSGRPRIVW